MRQQVELTEAQKKLPDELKKLVGAVVPWTFVDLFHGNVGETVDNNG